MVNPKFLESLSNVRKDLPEAKTSKYRVNNFARIQKLNFWIISLHVQNPYFLGQKFICNPIFKIFTSNFTIHSGLSIGKRYLAIKNNPVKFMLRGEFQHRTSVVS